MPHLGTNQGVREPHLATPHCRADLPGRSNTHREHSTLASCYLKHWRSQIDNFSCLKIPSTGPRCAA